MIIFFQLSVLIGLSEILGPLARSGRVTKVRPVAEVRCAARIEMLDPFAKCGPIAKVGFEEIGNWASRGKQPGANNPYGPKLINKILT